jgi:hypothetical protein
MVKVSMVRARKEIWKIKAKQDKLNKNFAKIGYTAYQKRWDILQEKIKPWQSVIFVLSNKASFGVDTKVKTIDPTEAQRIVRNS